MIPSDVVWFTEPFLAALDPPDPDAVVAAATEIVERHRHTAVDEPGLGILWFTALSVAGFRQLRSTHSPEQAVSAFRHAFLDPFYDWVRAQTAAALDASANPVDVLRDESKRREAHFFGRAFTFDRPQDDEHGYIAVVRGCYYQRLLVAEGVPELLRTFCDFDTAWMDAADERRHGVRVERPTTFGYGGPSCWFVMTKLSEPAPA